MHDDYFQVIANPFRVYLLSGSHSFTVVIRIRISNHAQQLERISIHSNTLLLLFPNPTSRSCLSITNILDSMFLPDPTVIDDLNFDINSVYYNGGGQVNKTDPTLFKIIQRTNPIEN